MSSPPATVYDHATPALGPITAAATPTSPPIVQFARVASHALALSFTYLLRASSVLTQYSLTPLSLLYTPALYLLSPIIVLSQILVDIFVLSPYTILASLARNIYPLYVFVGIACICAAFCGYVARMVSIGITYLIFAPRPSVPDSEDGVSDGPPTTMDTSKRRRVFIKEER
ncbi:hypothetical protein C8Q77DRAFT_613658 [Trametes polyzona]|nr:hypothetical protein C8Q77DRAFT_613658 [Trametes polyzona]